MRGLTSSTRWTAVGHGLLFHSTADFCSKLYYNLTCIHCDCNRLTCSGNWSSSPLKVYQWEASPRRLAGLLLATVCSSTLQLTSAANYTTILLVFTAIVIALPAVETDHLVHSRCTSERPHLVDSLDCCWPRSALPLYSWLLQQIILQSYLLIKYFFHWSSRCTTTIAKLFWKSIIFMYCKKKTYLLEKTSSSYM